MTFDEYVAIDAINWSSLKHLAHSATRYRHELDSPRTADTDPQLAGQAIHCAALEPDKYGDRFVPWTGGARRGRAWSEFCETIAPAKAITLAMHKAAMGIMQSVHEHPVAKLYLNKGQSEHSIVWAHPKFDALCKSRLDWITDEIGIGPVVVDLKTVTDATSDAVTRSISSMLYHGQAAFYSDAYEVEFGCAPKFIFVFAEREPPYQVAVYTIEADWIEAGRIVYEKLLQKLMRCRGTNDWPGINDWRETELIAPRWTPGLDEVSLELTVGGKIEVVQ